DRIASRNRSNFLLLMPGAWGRVFRVQIRGHPGATIRMGKGALATSRNMPVSVGDDQMRQVKTTGEGQVRDRPVTKERRLAVFYRLPASLAEGNLAHELPLIDILSFECPIFK